MDYSWFWQYIDGQYFLELLPYHFPVIVPAIEPVPPPSPGLLIDFLKLAIVAAYTIILIVPLQLLAYHSVLFFDGEMPVLFAPLPQCFDTPPQPFPGRLPFDDPVSLP